jgi:hypothetical protein
MLGFRLGEVAGLRERCRGENKRGHRRSFRVLI